MKKIIVCLVCLCILSGCQPSTQAPIPPVNEDKPPLNQHPTQKPQEEDVQTKQEEEPIDEPSAPLVSDQEQPEIKQELPSVEEPKVVETPPVVNTPPVEEEIIETVMISIECSTINNNLDKLKPGYLPFIPSNGIILSTKTMEIEDGDTVLSVLKKSGVKLVESAGFVSSIENIDVSICGNLSGWMYSVNGEFINVSASSKKVENGDIIKWMYTCDNGRDLSFN